MNQNVQTVHRPAWAQPADYRFYYLRGYRIGKNYGHEQQQKCYSSIFAAKDSRKDCEQQKKSSRPFVIMGIMKSNTGLASLTLKKYISWLSMLGPGQGMLLLHQPTFTG